MRVLRFIVAMAVGFLLYAYVVVYVGGFLAAVGIPAGYFGFFGKSFLDMGLALLNLGLHTLPTVVLIAGGVLATHRLLPALGPTIWSPIAVGMLSCLLLWALVLSPGQMETYWGVESKGVLDELRSLFVFPWWAASNFAAPWLGVGLAAWLLSRSKRTTARRA